MYFNSISFLVFMVIVFFLYWKIDEKYRWILLLASSYYFYIGWGSIYLLILICVTIISYITGILIQRNAKPRSKKILVTAVIVSMIFLLCGFKYSIFSMHPFALKLVMPVGISFYTFKIISYLVDVYRGEEPEYHLGRYAVFIAFFPEISSGPIDRGKTLLAQLAKIHVFDYNKVTYGLKLIAWGFFKKVIIADVLAGYVDKVYGALSSYQGFVLVLVSLFFTIQIYCDFSGYSDMAVGIAKLLDIDIVENFRSPYFSASIKEFWQRWHISLSSWLRDYVYIPLGGNRCRKARWMFNLLVTFLVSGIWHGAGFTFVLWGVAHGVAQIVESYLYKKEVFGWRKAVRIGVTFLFCNFVWIFFRAASLEQVRYILVKSFVGINNPIAYIQQAQAALQIDVFMFIRIVILLAILFLFDYFNKSKNVILMISQQKTWVRWLIYITFVFITILFLPVKKGTDFIYFQF